MNRKEEKIWKRIGEIRKQIWLSLVFCTLGMLLAWFGFSQFGDNFMHDIWIESAGRWPVYLLFGTAAGGAYLTIKYMSEKVENGLDYRNSPLSNTRIFMLFYCAMLLLSPVLFIILVFYRFYQLRKLVNSLPDDRGQQ